MPLAEKPSAAQTLKGIVSLRTLEKEGEHESGPNYLDAMLLRIIPPQSNVASGKMWSAYILNNRKHNQYSSSANYSRLFLCKVFTHEENSCLFYMMESRNSNNLPWQRNTQLHDNGMITIGAIFIILVPLPIENLMSGNTPIVETCYPVIVMKHSSQHIPTVKIDYSIEGNTANAFVQPQSMTPEET
eukprot:12424996-Ditylum_brightwellii.AAC.1